MNDQKEKCIQCERSSEEVPLIAMRFRGENVWICPQHLPILIHNPIELVGKLPGAETLSPAEHHD
jgi:hypothetical protein